MTCKICGLPDELCVCETIAKESQKIAVDIEKKKFGKYSTVLRGFDPSVDLKELCKNLKGELACGGTVKLRKIILQGNHIKKIKDLLVSNGFPENSIQVREKIK
jgi:translation initiation factor 1